MNNRKKSLIKIAKHQLFLENTFQYYKKKFNKNKSLRNQLFHNNLYRIITIMI